MLMLPLKLACRPQPMLIRRFLVVPPYHHRRPRMVPSTQRCSQGLQAIPQSHGARLRCLPRRSRRNQPQCCRHLPRIAVTPVRGGLPARRHSPPTRVSPWLPRLAHRRPQRRCAGAHHRERQRYARCAPSRLPQTSYHFCPLTPLRLSRVSEAPTTDALLLNQRVPQARTPKARTGIGRTIRVLRIAVSWQQRTSLEVARRCLGVFLKKSVVLLSIG